MFDSLLSRFIMSVEKKLNVGYRVNCNLSFKKVMLVLESVRWITIDVRPLCWCGWEW